MAQIRLLSPVIIVGTFQQNKKTVGRKRHHLPTVPRHNKKPWAKRCALPTAIVYGCVFGQVMV
jgi:hypothetical protein